MFPTIDDLIKKSTSNAANDSGIVITGANDTFNSATNATMSRIIAERNASEENRKKKAVNDNIDQVNETMNKILDRHNANAGTPNWVKRRTNRNDNDFVPDGGFAANIVDSDGPSNRTMDRIMGKHNYHPDPLIGDNDNGGGKNSADKYLVYPDELPDYANDFKHKGRKPQIFRHREHLPAAETGEDQVRPVKKDKTHLGEYVDGDKKTDSVDREDDSIVDILHSIEGNTAETASGVAMLIGAFDDMGIDSLKERERELESRNGYMAGTGEKGSDRAREGKEKDSDGGIVEGIRDIITGGSGLAIAGLASLFGVGAEVADANDGVNTEEVNRGGGVQDSERTPGSQSKDKQGGVVPSETKAPGSIAGDFTGRERAFLDMISRNEGASYNTTFGMNKKGQSKYITPEKMYDGRHLTDLNINEVMKYQDALRRQNRKDGIGGGLGSSAVGKGQFLKGTMTEALGQMGYTKDQYGSMKLTPELQDAMILHLARKKRGLDPNSVESWGEKERKELGKEWESLDVSKGKISSSNLTKELENIRNQSTVRTNIKPTQSRDPQVTKQTSLLENLNTTMGRLALAINPGVAIAGAGVRSMSSSQSPRGAQVASTSKPKPKPVSVQNNTTNNQVNVHNNNQQPVRAPKRRKEATGNWFLDWLYD